MKVQVLHALALALCASLFFGCGLLSLDEKKGGLRNLIERNKSNWKKRNIKNYSLLYDKKVGGSETNDVYVLVVQEEIDSVSVGGAAAESFEGFLTVDRLYAEIEKNFERDDRGTFQVNFNEEFSYPLRYRMLPGETTEGRGVVVENFEVISDDK